MVRQLLMPLQLGGWSGWTITSTGLQLGEYSLIIRAASAPSDVALLPSCHGQMSSELRIEYIANVRWPMICPKGTNEMLRTIYEESK